MPVPNLDTVRPGHANKAVEAGVHTSFVHSSIIYTVDKTGRVWYLLGLHIYYTLIYLGPTYLFTHGFSIILFCPARA